MQPPERPVGVKLELTYRCNLSCPFCYTDSPRRTREGTADLPDDAWRDLVRQAVELGVIEAVVTGGEPLLRRDLSLELLETLDGAGVGVTLNTNGWFVDDAVADRLALLEGLQVNLSIDGATPELHDASRRGSGSWERVIGAADRLLRRGVNVYVIHVVTPANERHVPDFLEQMWLLGVPAVRLAVVVKTGAAARSGDWSVDRRALRRLVAEAERRYEEELRINLNAGSLARLAAVEDVPPASLLVRPNGSVLIDSMKPFLFGSATEEGLEAVWQRMAETWPHPEVSEWAAGVRRADALDEAAPNPYRDEELPVEGVVAPPSVSTRSARRIPTGVPDVSGSGDLVAARQRVAELVLARRYRLGRVRFTGPPAAPLVRVPARRRVHRLNETAAIVMKSCAGGTTGDAAAALAARYPSLTAERARADAIAATRRLVACEILEPVA